MKKIMFCTLLGLLSLTVLLSGCGGGSSPRVLFQDDFNYTATYPANWTPSNGWSSGNWAITTGGFSGNGIQYNHATLAGYLTNNYTGSNYKISAKVKPGAVVGDGSLIGIIGRYADSTSFYTLVLRTYSASGPTEIGVYKMWLDGAIGNFGAIGAQQFLTGALTPGTFYDLTFEITGSSPVTLVGKVSNGSTAVDVSVTDDGVSRGAPISSGQVGLLVIPYSPYYPTFDNFLVKNR